MMERKVLVGVFGALFIFSMAMIVVETNQSPQVMTITGHATSGSTTSNVTISKYFSIALSANLSDGIQFGTVSVLPATNVNATHNNDSALYNTTMYLNVSEDSNTNVDFCILSPDDLTDESSSATIGRGNETYANSTTVVGGAPDVADEVALTGSYVKSGYNVTTGGANYYKFWLDIPTGTASGSYNNTVEFKAVEVATAC
jgi:hypothetical protein